jgi:hypothetical protein
MRSRTGSSGGPAKKIDGAVYHGRHDRDRELIERLMGLYTVVSVPLVWAAAPETTVKTLEQM